MFSEVLTTVSPQYAREIQGPEMGYGLDAVLRARSGDLVGILNGVDYGEWDPRARPAHRGAVFPRTTSPARRSASWTCCSTMGLPAEPDLPVVGVISRLVAQKGFDIVVDAWYDLLQRPLRMVVLGTGDHAARAGVPVAGRARPGPLRGALHLRRGARPPDRGRRRHVPDAVAVRALRAHPDVQPALRHRAHRARHRRPRRHRRALGPGRPAAAPASASTPPTAPGSCGPSTRPWRPSRTGRPGTRLMRNGMEKDFSWDRSAAAVRRRLPAGHEQGLGPGRAGPSAILSSGDRPPTYGGDLWPRRSRPSPTRTGKPTS